MRQLWNERVNDLMAEDRWRAIHPHLQGSKTHRLWLRIRACCCCRRFKNIKECYKTTNEENEGTGSPEMMWNYRNICMDLIKELRAVSADLAELMQEHEAAQSWDSLDSSQPSQSPVPKSSKSRLGSLSYNRSRTTSRMRVSSKSHLSYKDAAIDAKLSSDKQYVTNFTQILKAEGYIQPDANPGTEGTGNILSGYALVWDRLGKFRQLHLKLKRVMTEIVRAQKITPIAFDKTIAEWTVEYEQIYKYFVPPSLQYIKPNSDYLLLDDKDTLILRSISDSVVEKWRKEKKNEDADREVDEGA